MTPDEMRTALDALRWSQRGLADALACDPRLVRRWAAGDASIPPAIAAWLRRLAAYHHAHPAPAGWRRREPPPV